MYIYAFFKNPGNGTAKDRALAAQLKLNDWKAYRVTNIQQRDGHTDVYIDVDGRLHKMNSVLFKFVSSTGEDVDIYNSTYEELTQKLFALHGDAFQSPEVFKVKSVLRTQAYVHQDYDNEDPTTYYPVELVPAYPADRHFGTHLEGTKDKLRIFAGVSQDFTRLADSLTVYYCHYDGGTEEMIRPLYFSEMFPVMYAIQKYERDRLENELQKTARAI